MNNVRVAIRLRFVKLPSVKEERVFRDLMYVRDSNEQSFEDLGSMVERKLQFMDIPRCDFTVFHQEAGGDRLVVDDAYFHSLLKQWIKEARHNHPPPVHEGQGHAVIESDSDPEDDVQVTFEVEVHRVLNDLATERANNHVLRDKAYGHVAPVSAPLTVENLAKVHLSAARVSPPGVPATSVGPSTPIRGTSGEVRVSVAQLTCPPVPPHFFLRCVVCALRFKTPKPGVSVVEIDLCDADDPAQLITATTFDQMVQKAVQSNLRADRRQVVELRQVYVRRKTTLDERFQTNNHPLLLRMDRGSRVEVVQLLTIPINAASAGRIVTIRDHLKPNGLVDLSELTAFTRSNEAACRSSGSPSVSGSQRRTVFTLSSGNSGSSGAHVSGVVPSLLGQQLRKQQEQIVQHKRREEDVLYEPGVIHVTHSDVHRRLPLVEQHANQEALRKERIRRRVEVNSSCLLCGLNCDDEIECMGTVERLLKASSRNQGLHMPNFDQVKSALCDRRRVQPGETPTRLVCKAHFVNVATRTVHVVHCRCAHLCTSYQAGKELEDIAICDLAMQVCTLCGLAGACVSCYHPDCNEMYHVVCALFSGGYVNFGKKDPYLPCPACPRHTLVQVSSKRRSGDVLHMDSSCWEDNIAFDSRVVESTDLRDPDENEGE